MLKVFRYLLLLREQGFWGEVRLQFKGGEVTGPINVSQGYVVDTLPQPMPGTVAATAIAEQEKQMGNVFAEAHQGKRRVS